MGLPCRLKASVDTEVDLHVAVLKPRSAPFRQLRWFLALGNPRKAAVERASLRFLASRHRELYMVDSDDRHVPSGAANPKPRTDRQKHREASEVPKECDRASSS